MSAGILIIAHGRQGEALVDCARHVLGETPERVVFLSAGQDEDREAVLAAARAAIARLDTGGGVLLLTDLYGSTPFQICQALLESGRVTGASGLSLPMLLRAIRYRDQPLETVRERALSAAQECSAALA